MKAEPIVVVFEIATLDLENTLERYLALYKDRKVKIIKDFATRIRELWEKHRRKIEQIALRLHYNAIAVIPGNLNLPEFHEQMTQGYEITWESDKFKDGGSWSGIKSFQVEKDRIVLFHNCLNLGDHLFTKQLLGKNLMQISGFPQEVLNKRIIGKKPFKGQINVYDKQQTFAGLAIEDYLAIQAETWTTTKRHLDSETCSLLVRSYCGPYIPGFYMDPVVNQAGQLCADVFGFDNADGGLAPRPATVFD
ncbi:MAG TPA: hypothetical protein VJC04_00460 [Candidatus Paceibacterota bacterium]